MRGGPREQISAYQVAAILFFVRLVPRTLICPTTMVQPPYQDIWLADAVGALLAVGFVAVVCRLGVLYRGQSIIEYSQHLLHPILGKLLGLILTGYFLFVAAYTVRMLGESFVITILPRTPLALFMVMTAVLAANAARSGLEVVARMAEFLLPLTVLLLLALLVLPLDLADTYHLRPVLAAGIASIVPAASIEFMFYLEFIVLGMLIPHLRVPERAVRQAVVFTLGLGVMIIVMCLVMISVFGPTLNAFVLQMFMLARMIARVESLVLASWILSTGVRLSVFIWAISACLKQSLGLSSGKPLCYAAAGLVVVAGLVLFEDVVHMVRFIAEPWTVVSIVSVLGLVICLWGAHFGREWGKG